MVCKSRHADNRSFYLFRIAGCFTSIFFLLLANSADGKFGAPIETFKQKLGHSFTYLNAETKNNKTYQHFTLIVEEKVQRVNPGFSGGLTLTLENGKISGESFLVGLGSDRDLGQKLAGILCLNLAYEALGKPIPNSSKDQEIELNSYTRAVREASSGSPGHINYPGYSSQLIFSRTEKNELLFVIIPSAPAKN